MKHNDETKHTYLALLTTEGRLAFYETEQPEAINEYSVVDEFLVVPSRPQRGEETAFKCVFDPNPEPCYAALRAGVPTDALGLAVAAMDVVKIYRTRDVVQASYGVDAAKKQFYLAAQVDGHRGLVRDIAWAPGNIRGYDMVATACQDGYARVFRVDTPVDDRSDGRSPWAASELVTPEKSLQRQRAAAARTAASGPSSSAASASPTRDDEKPQNGHPQPHQPSSTLSASLANKAAASGGGGSPGLRTSQPGQVAHTVRELAKLDNHRTPVWRVGFDDDGQILGTTGDDGKLLCYRQTPDGGWAKSSEMVMMKTRMAAP